MTSIHPFSSDISKIQLPEEFDYPYNYTPHKLAQIASEELQKYLINQTDFIDNFGINNHEDEVSVGKMFGVLVVQQQNGSLAYLAAFSGKLAGKTQHKYFVPPIFDVLDEKHFYLKTEEKLNAINFEIQKTENSVEYTRAKIKYQQVNEQHLKLITSEKVKIKQRRKLRKKAGQQNNQQNINEEFYLREYEVYLLNKIKPLQKVYFQLKNKIDQLKEQRANLSAWAQKVIFKSFTFYNYNRGTKNLLDIFSNTTQNIPAGAGECCAPKLLQYAFIHHLKPICMAEFWWGKPLKTSVRKHQNYYPACTGKCKPILTFMLQGLQVAKNPLYFQLSKEKELTVIHEDEDILVIDKPHELLTVSGKEINDSVHSRIQKLYPKATGPLIVHRLDMSTSGILLIAKNKKSYKFLQAQFINKTIHKRYVALLNGVLKEKSGSINLPLRVDLNDRPKQLVCYEHGKKALTKWKAIEINNSLTKVYFYPITGRTHQLRVHAAHQLGLNTPILGDDLYGTKTDRLYLHAEKITFMHPSTKKEVTFTCPSPF